MSTRARGLQSLVHDALDLTLDLVEEGHGSVARTAARLLGALTAAPPPLQLADDLRRLATAPTIGTIRAVNRLVKGLTDAGLEAAVAARLLQSAAAPAAPVPMRSDITGSAAWLSDAALGALNGVAGDYLHRAGNGLDLGFSLRHGDVYLDLDGAAPLPGLASRRLVVLVHGLAATEWSWCWDAAAHHGDPETNFGTLLQRDLGALVLFARYNSGRRVFDNGRSLAACLERLSLAQPAAIDEILLIGHSMGGLVARSACEHGARAGHGWTRALSRVVCLGSPHQGAPLEKLGHLLTGALAGIDHPGTRIPAEILRRRSAGIRDLRHGTISEEPDRRGADEAGGAGGAPVSLDHVRYFFASATVTRDRSHPVGHLLGDLLVRVASASGPPGGGAALPIETACFGGLSHTQIQVHPDVYAWLRRVCAGTGDDRPC